MVSCPLKKLSRERKEQILAFKSNIQVKKGGGFTSSNYYESFYKNRRVIVSYSEKLRLQGERTGEYDVWQRMLSDMPSRPTATYSGYWNAWDDFLTVDKTKK